MTVLHFVTSAVYPAPGGMQESVLRIARGLAGGDSESIVYTINQPREHREVDPGQEEPSVVHLGLEEDLILEPFRAAEQAPVIEGEMSRARVLLLRNAIARRIADGKSKRHAIISFYASGTGFFAQQVAATLKLPHIASIRGSDFATDFTSRAGHARVRFVVEKADQVVATNREQATTLSALFNLKRSIRVIHNAISDARDRPHWRPPESDATRLISDSGFSGRKGSHYYFARCRL